MGWPDGSRLAPDDGVVKEEWLERELAWVVVEGRSEVWALVDV